MTEIGIPELPVLSLRGWRIGPDREFGMPFRSRQALATSSGTAAIALALESAGVGAGDEVLYPALNCLSMREAAWLHGARDVLYRVHEDLAINLRDLAARVTPATRAVVVVHYFGFPQPLDELRALCTERGLALIEDRAHALLLPAAMTRAAVTGDYVVGSATKFFPVMDGGFLLAPAGFRGPALEVASAKRDLRAAWNAVETAVHSGRLWLLAPLLRPVYAWRRRRRRARPAATANGTAVPGQEGLYHVGHDDYRRPMTRTSRTTLAAYSLDSAARRRRKVYQRLAAFSVTLSRARPLYPKLPDGVVPYMLPLLLAEPGEDFARLKVAGLPMYRWEDCGESDCPVTARYRDALVQIPCHEQLTDAELGQMEGILDAVLRRGPT